MCLFRFRLLAVVLLCMSFINAEAKDFFVSPSGSDAGVGSKESPFATIEKARDAARETNSFDCVILLPGRYFRTQTLELNSSDSDTTFTAEQPGTVFIDGGITVPYSKVGKVTDSAIKERLLETARDSIVQIDLKAMGIDDYGTFGPRGFRRAYIPAPMELNIDSQPQQIARWPNIGEKHIPLGKVVEMGSVPRSGEYDMRPGTFEYGTPRALRWTKAKDLYLSGIFNYGYADDTIKVAKIDTEDGTFTTDIPHIYGFAKRSFTSWYAINLIEEIDQPGEYCIDKESGLLLFLPPVGFNSDSLIQLSMMEDVMVAMENCKNVQFENITFENSRGIAVYIEEGQGNLLAGCTFRNLGIMAVQMGQGIEPYPFGMHDGCGNKADGKPGVPVSRQIGSWHEYIYTYTAWNRNAGFDHKLLSCDIYNTGAGGVLLGGGDRKTLRPGNNSIENCDIYQVNRLERTYKAPVNIDGVGNKITNNRIHDCEGMGIYLHGNDHIVEYNRIYNVLTDMSDQGAIYMGRDPSESGNQFRYNFFHDIYNRHSGGHGVQAIFFDDMCTYGATIYGNVFVKAGSTGVVKFNGGGESPVVKNIMVDCPRIFLAGNNNYERVVEFMAGEMGKQRLTEQVNILVPPYSIKYPVVTDIYNGKRHVSFPELNNYQVKGDYSQFVDAKNWNFNLKPDSKVYKEMRGFKPIPFDKIGLYTDSYRKTLPSQLPPRK